MTRQKARIESYRVKIPAIPPFWQRTIQKSLKSCDNHSGTPDNLAKKINKLANHIEHAQKLEPEWNRLEQQFNAIKNAFNAAPLTADASRTRTIRAKIDAGFANFPMAYPTLAKVEKQLQVLQSLVAQLMSERKPVKRIRLALKEQDADVQPNAEENVIKMFQVNPNLMNVLYHFYLDFRYEDYRIDELFRNPQGGYIELIRLIADTGIFMRNVFQIPKNKPRLFVESIDEIQQYLKKVDQTFIRKYTPYENYYLRADAFEHSAAGYDISSLQHFIDSIKIVKSTSTFDGLVDYLSSQKHKNKK